MTADPVRTDALARLLDLDPTRRTAVEWCGRALTYAQLATAVDDLARRLVELGAPRTNVLVLGPLSPAYLVGLLAALRCGAVPVPVDAGTTADRYAWTERAARPSVVLSSDVSTVTQYRGTHDAPELVLDAATGRTVLDTPAGAPAAARLHRYPDPDAGYLIPTSGSTGAAKAVVGSRTGLHAFLTWFSGEFALGPLDVCAAVTRVSFDPSLRELLAVLTAGGTLCLPEADAQLDLLTLGGHLARNRATIAFLVPSLARRVADGLRTAGTRLDHLRYAFFAGEVLPARVVEQWSELAPDAELVNLYGMTEGTLAQLYRRDVRAGDARRTTGLPVGRPRPGVSVELDRPDADGRGEVLITSAAPALGLLAEGPGPRPGTLRVEPMAGALRTGDIGCWTEDGELVVAGRVGNDLKVSGRRVSFHRFVDEVEELADVRQCVVVDRQGPQAFVGTVDLAPGQDRSLHERIRDVAKRLGLPRPAVHLRAELPLLRSGKVDRIALAASVADRPEPAAAVEQDADVTTVLRGLLGLGPEDPADVSFVDAGLSSLDMMEFVLEVNRRYGSELTVQACFARRDVASLARALERAGRAAPVDGTDPAPAAAGGPPTPGPDGAEVPLSTRQIAYVATCMADGNANWCNLSREIPLDRVVTPQELAAALGTLIARHDVLRLSLTPDGSRQVHTEAADLRCPVTVHPAPAGRQTEAQQRARIQQARADAVAPLIDPTTGPPLRAAVVQEDATSSVLLVAHHLFVDGLSMDLLAAELRSALLGLDLGEAPPPTSFRDYCRATRRASSGRTPDADHWDRLLAGAEQVELAEGTGPDAREGEITSRPFGVTGARTAHRLAAASGVSVFSVVLAAFDRAVTRTFGPHPLTIVVPVQIREGTRASAAGMFMSQLIVRGAGSNSLSDNAREFSQQLEDGTERSGWEFDQRVEALGLTGSDCFPLSTVLFNQHPKRRGLRVRDLGAWQPRPLGRTLRYQLQGELQVSGSEMALTYYYRRGIGVAGPDVIDRLHTHVLAELSAAGRALHGEQ
ncbi:hypothetical protein GCM10010495_10150 [Kitasatospora herbaricolor]|uniref:AMP-binding protein n=1 Tax=Kitasatospora herbaricolor TaxID=68217 RepID=UPI001748B5B1|nr:AMP-binding protein [Kitasatospora herbaricolor]MDQ0309550.1 acyl-coenzyme A synthetase/AMP-(fatty) acid ligase/acyl carrier protein [Kitasatospora herbaricolor]GGV01099.1 hypothetical protein GCM10010495_10150 [Kitasatospora herbaricolor]